MNKRFDLKRMLKEIEQDEQVSLKRKDQLSQAEIGRLVDRKQKHGGHNDGGGAGPVL
jgi:hypothetical protein